MVATAVTLATGLSAIKGPRNALTLRLAPDPVRLDSLPRCPASAINSIRGLLPSAPGAGGASCASAHHWMMNATSG